MKPAGCCCATATKGRARSAPAPRTGHQYSLRFTNTELSSDEFAETGSKVAYYTVNCSELFNRYILMQASEFSRDPVTSNNDVLALDVTLAFSEALQIGQTEFVVGTNQSLE